MTITNATDTSMSKVMIQLAAMKRLTSAAVDPAGLAISKKLTSQYRGLDVGADNTLAAQDLYRTAEGGLESIGDSLSRIRELAVQASNGIYTTSDRANIQAEIDQLKQGIESAARGTEFNTMKLLDGSFTDKHVASNPDGGGSSIQLVSSTLDTLGIRDFDVTTGKFDIGQIDNAIKMVTDSRSGIGASMNRLEHTFNYNQNASLNLQESNSRIADLDVGKAITERQKLNILQQYQIFAQQSQANSMRQQFSMLM